jgi:hypothetical protein
LIIIKVFAHYLNFNSPLKINLKGAKENGNSNRGEIHEAQTFVE